MKEQLLNLLYILPVMLPLFLGGVMVRFSRRYRTDGWRVTAISAAVSVLVWLAVLCLNRGSELLGGHCLCSDGVSRRGSSVRPWPAVPPC